MQSMLKLIRKMTTTADLASMRIKYRGPYDVFLEQNITVKDPFHLFKEWLNEAVQHPDILEPNAFCLATVSENGCPSARFVLMKAFDEKGLTFFTNYASRKAKNIEANPNVAATFYWLPLRRQVRIEGTIEKVSNEESVEYFHMRPRASQIGALASPQSQQIPNREYLDGVEKEIKDKLQPSDLVPMPNWGGYLVKPHTMEFWQGQTNRLHDRIQFRSGEACQDEVDGKLVHSGENGWVYERLAP